MDKLAFGVPLDNDGKYLSKGTLNYITGQGIWFVSLLFHMLIPYLMGLHTFKMLMVMNFFYWSALGATFFFVVLPNHDTRDTVVHHHIPSKEKMDWGAMQLVNSGNHSTSKHWLHLLISALWGGMNYQIEHHVRFILL